MGLRLAPAVRERIGPLAIAVAAAALLVRSWLKWPDVLVDYGQQLYVAWRLAEGEVLYRDVAYFHGPLSSYVHAGVLRLWGTGLLSLTFFNLLVLAALIVLIYRMVADLAGRRCATVACLVFVTVFAFAQYLRIGNYNYVCPYTYEVTHGVALALASLYGLMRYDGHGRQPALALSGLALGLVFLTKAEVFLAAATAIAAGLVAAVRRQRLNPGEAWMRFATLAGPAVSGPLLAVGLFSLAMTPAEAFEGVTAAYSSLFRQGTSDLLFYRSRMGLDAPLVNLGRLLVAASWHLAVLGPGVVAAFLWRSESKARSLVLASLAWLPVVFVARHVGSAVWLQAARPLPLLTVILVWVSVAAFVRERRRLPTVFAASTAGAFALAVFASVLLVKIGLNSRVYHYGFVLAMPATLLLVVCWVEWIPAWIDRRGGKAGVFRAVAVAVLGVAVTAHVLASDRRWREKTYLVGAGGDAFWSDPRGRAVDAAVAYFSSLEGAAPTLVVVPDGIMLSYLARVPSTVPYLNYVPTEVFAYGEDRILADLRKNPPDYVAMVEKSTAEFGYRYFGRDYGRDLLGWIDETYRPVGLIGAEPLTGRGFGIKIMKRDSTPSAAKMAGEKAQNPGTPSSVGTDR